MLRAQVIRDVTSVWNATFDPENPQESAAVAKRLLMALVRERYPTSAQLAAAYYRQLRSVAGFLGSFDPVVAPMPPSEQLDASISSTGVAAYRIARRSGQTPRQAKETSSVTLSGSVSRLVASGGRETIHRTVDSDPRALGYIRVTDADPCHFCAMLASRGPVYKNAATAGDPRGGGRRYHDHDACSVAPVFSRSGDWESRVEDLSDRWARATSGLSGEQARNAWRSYWENRED